MTGGDLESGGQGSEPKTIVAPNLSYSASVNGRWIVLAILALGLGLRVFDLGGKSLWADEAYSWFFASMDLTEIWSGGGPDLHHPPLYHTILHWVLPVSGSEAMLRLPSAIASTATIGVIFFLARQLAGWTAALFAALLTAVSPLDVWYAQEARQAAIAVLLLTVAAYCVTRQDLFGRITGAASLAGAFLVYYTTPLAWAAVLGTAVVVDWRAGHKLVREWLWITIPALALFIPIQGSHFSAGISHLQSTTQHRIFEMILSISGLDRSPIGLLVLGAIAAALTAGAIRLAIRAAPRTTVVIAALLFTLVVIVAPFPRGYSFKRIVVVFWPLVVVLVAYVVTTYLSRRWSRTALLALVTVSVVASAMSLSIPKDDWRSAIANINATAGQNDQVWIVTYSGPWAPAPYAYYHAWPELVAAPEVDSYPGLASTSRGDIWIVAMRTPRDSVPATDGEAWLDDNWDLVEERPFHRLTVKRFSPP